jgi:hypothetical protein
MHRWFRRPAIITPVSVVAFALVLLAGSPSAAQDPSTKPDVRSAVKHDTSPALRTMKPTRAAQA